MKEKTENGLVEYPQIGSVKSALKKEGRANLIADFAIKAKENEMSRVHVLRIIKKNDGANFTFSYKIKQFGKQFWALHGKRVLENMNSNKVSIEAIVIHNH